MDKKAYIFNSLSCVCLPIALLSLWLFIPEMAYAEEIFSSPEVSYIFNTLFLLFSGSLVMWMAAGFCMLESGLVNSKNAAVICLKNFVLYAIACLTYFLFGYNLMFQDVGQWIGSFTAFTFLTSEEMRFFSDTENITNQKLLWDRGTVSLASVFFQMVFVATAASVISGALAERIRLWSFFIFVAILCAFLYPITGAWTWGNGWLAQMGFKDFAGSTVVHSVGGWAALMGVLFVGPRKGKYKDGKVIPTPASSLPLVTLGTFILWFGWLGFNGGSILSLSSTLDAATAGLVFFNTNLAASGGVVSALVTGLLLYKRVQILVVLNGALSGLVAITASPDISNPLLALLIGCIGSVLATLASSLLDKMRIDDVVGAIPVHLVAGIWGTLAVGIFTEVPFHVQLVGVLSVGGFICLCSALLWWVIKRFMGLRVSEDSELLGQDIIELGVEAYPEFINLNTLK